MLARLPIYHEVFVKDGVLTKETADDYDIAINRLMERGRSEGVIPVAIFDEEKNIIYYATAVDGSGFSPSVISEMCGLQPYHNFASTARIPVGIDYP